MEHPVAPSRVVPLELGGMTYQAALLSQTGQPDRWAITAEVTDEEGTEQVHVVTVEADGLDKALVDLTKQQALHLGAARPHLDKALQSRRHHAVLRELRGKLS